MKKTNILLTTSFAFLMLLGTSANASASAVDIPLADLELEVEWLGGSSVTLKTTPVSASVLAKSIRLSLGDEKRSPGQICFVKMSSQKALSSLLAMPTESDGLNLKLDQLISAGVDPYDISQGINKTDEIYWSTSRNVEISFPDSFSISSMIIRSDGDLTFSAPVLKLKRVALFPFTFFEVKAPENFVGPNNLCAVRIYPSSMIYEL